MNLIEYINCDIGTNSYFEISKGNTLPMLCRPFGMQGITIENNINESSWIYNPNVDLIKGFRITQQPSPWIKDYGYISFMPVSNDFDFSDHSVFGAYRKIDFTPGFWNFECLRSYTTVKIVPTKNTFYVEVNSIDSSPIRLAFKAKESVANVCESTMSFISHIHENEYSTNKENFKKYYTIQFDNSIKYSKQDNDYIYIEFEKDRIEFEISSSFCSLQQSMLNQTSLSIKDGKEIAIAEWNEKLSRIEIEDTEENMRTFYSNMYRALIYPFNITEINENGELIHKNFDSDKVEFGEMITGIGFWDTYRTSFPFYRIFYNEEYKLFIRAMINFYRETGWLPRWMSPNEVGCMPSTMCDIVLCEAIKSNNVEKSDLTSAYEALLKNAYSHDSTEIQGRSDLKSYLQYNYIPYDRTINSVISTLDYCYCDQAISEILPDAYVTEKNDLQRRSKFYKNLFDNETQFFRAKDKSGEFRSDFNPYTWGEDYCESSAWQNCLNIPFDIEGLIGQYGSTQNIITRLDNLMNTSPCFKRGLYEKPIHEQHEITYTNIGQVAISNQPSFNILYYYHKLNEYEKFEILRDKLLSEFKSDMNGYPGDEDNGSMSSWYIFSYIGIYPFEPASLQFLKFPAKGRSLNLSMKYDFSEFKSDEKYEVIKIV